MAQPAPPATSVPAAPAAGIRPDSCLGRTCLKWGADGELSDLDLQLVLERLSRVDACSGSGPDVAIW